MRTKSEYEFARTMLEYDKKTGLLYWKKHMSAKAMVGTVAGRPDFDGYIQVKVNGSSFKAHRLVWFFERGEIPSQIDHINGNRSDNRIENLRIANHQQNGWNRGPTKANTSGTKGVSWNKCAKKWVAYGTVNKGKKLHLGSFIDIKDAILTRKKWEAENHKEFARVEVEG